jgi:hypothetical protein
MGTVVIIGHGPNDIKIPALIMESEDRAHKLLFDTFGEPRSEEDGTFIYDTNPSYNREAENVIKFYTSYYGDAGSATASL